MLGDRDLPVLRWGIVGMQIPQLWPDFILAVGSSSTAKGSKFVTEHCPSQQPTVYDAYNKVYTDPDVDIVYIGTPHVLHCQNALDAIAAGKHVLCEKPIAINARDANKMMDAAQEKGVFLMEAVWTRFFPIAKKLKDLLHKQKVIGDIAAVFAEFGLNMPITDADPTKRTASRSLGAGALLDIGIYTLTWASLVLDTASSLQSRVQPSLTASMTFASETDLDKKVDEQTCVILRYPDLKAHAICTSSLLYKSGEEFARIQGSQGSISIGGPAASKPVYLVLRVKDKKEERLDFEVPGFGFHYEADAVAHDIKAGRTQSEICPLSTTLTIMSRMDDARSQCGLTYPQEE
ncbi:hypothetical protein F66182_59 [Fusarium sp. NRRL 66182]|nr:hypothetical protein F66182_59 [Fusarium sp. NRRL 66182]